MNNICPAIGTIIGAAIATISGFCLAWFTRRRDGQDRYLAVIGEFSAELHGRISDLKGFRDGSLVPLRCAIFAVQPFICADRFARLLQLLREYQALTEDQLNMRLTVVSQIAKDTGLDTVSEPFARTDHLLKDYLKKFREAVE